MIKRSQKKHKRLDYLGSMGLTKCQESGLWTRKNITHPDKKMDLARIIRKIEARAKISNQDQMQALFYCAANEDETPVVAKRLKKSLPAMKSRLFRGRKAMRREHAEFLKVVNG